MNGDRPAGILPAHRIAALAETGGIAASNAFDPDQIQPASLDLRLGPVAYRVRASFLPGPNATVAERVAALILHEIDLTKGALLEPGRSGVYIVPLQESLALPPDVAAATNPKSSTGRLDVFTRVIADRTREFETIPAGYRGPLYIEISPRTFPIIVRAGSRLSQIRFRTGNARLDDAELAALHAVTPLVDGALHLAGGLMLSIDLSDRDGIVGYRAKRHTGLVDVDKRGALDALDFWDPIATHGRRELVLDPDQFYILASRESVTVPPDYAAEMVPFDPLVGEFRVHYAGFFDPGFGHSEAGGAGSRAVLEVRSHEIPFILEHGQSVGRLVYERMLERPRFLYGRDIGSHYQAQGLKLSKHFRTPATMMKLDPVHPGEVLREEFLSALRLSRRTVANACGVPRTRIERLAREETPVTADTALRLSRYFSTTPAFWMGMQAQYDLERAEDELGDDLEKIVPRKAA